MNGELRIGFFSKRLIPRGEEITFDYKYERYGQQAQKCYCGSELCRGWLGGEPGKRADEEEDDDDEEDDEWSTSTSEEEEEETSLKPVARKAASKKVAMVAPEEVEEASSPVRPLEKSTDSAELLATPPRGDTKLVRRRRRRRLKIGSPRKIKNYEEDEVRVP